ncbi:site-specific DNA-methyltransferase, partial [Gemmatimonas sp.]|uniref:site-specific DNA-methyltransferase n=1 Tax=Gemmatimonas sp. TaxID=1962908 RepID=UPI0025BB23F8
MTIKRLRPSFTFTEERLDELRAVVPEAFADGRVNWEALKEALGEWTEPEGEGAEHFGLFWPGKREARRLAAKPSRGTLVPVPGEGLNEETTRNLFIEGDNLEVLKLLQKSYAGRVKMIYIDPPYNTGNDFVYEDDFRDPLGAYLQKTGKVDQSGEALTTNTRADGRFHSNWLSMMYPRLILARQLLREDGVIFVSIDDTEIANLRLLMDEVFGVENFVATIIWQKVFSPKNTARHFSEDHDYIVVYARHAESWMPTLLSRSAEADARYTNPDGDPRGVWTSGDLSARNYYGEGTYPVVTRKGRRIPGPPPGRYWAISKKKFDELNADGRIWWGPDGDNMPRLKRFLSEVKQGVVPQTLWKHEDVGNTQEAKKQLLERVTFESSDSVFDTPKPVRLIERMLRIATTPQAEDLVLDFFAGSGTTAEAVLKLNREDGGRRRHILVQMPEPTGYGDYPTIAEVTKTR